MGCQLKPFQSIPGLWKKKSKDCLKSANKFPLEAYNKFGGHQHVSQVKVIKGTPGDCVTIPAGSCYDRRTPDDPRYTNAYNFIHLDFEKGCGTVYLRWWNDRQNQWQKDQGAHEDGIINFDLPKDLGKKAPTTSTVSTVSTPQPVSDKSQREKQVIKAYLKALIRDHKDLDPRGIKQTRVQLVLPLEEIYVSLQADLDRPDVDRRVMQEDLDEIVDPTERRNIADAINRFVGAFRDAGLPEWLSQWISIDSSRYPQFNNGDEEVETGEETAEMQIPRGTAHGC
jgi:signal peptidase I